MAGCCNRPCRWSVATPMLLFNTRASPTSSRMVWMVLSACDCRYCCWASSPASAGRAMDPSDHNTAMQYCSSAAPCALPASAPSPLASVTTSASRLFLAGLPSSTIAPVTQAGALEPAAGHRQSVASAGGSKQTGANLDKHRGQAIS